MDVLQHHERQALCLAVVDEPNDVWMRRKFALHLEAGLKQLGCAGMFQAGSAQAPHGNHVLKFVCCHPYFRNASLRHTFVQYIFSKTSCHLIFRIHSFLDVWMMN